MKEWKNWEIWTLTIIFLTIWPIILHHFFKQWDTADLIFWTVIFTVSSWIVIACIQGIIWRVDNSVDLLATLETDEEKVKEQMMDLMNFRLGIGIVRTLEELNTIFRNYPQWGLKDWEVFRAWYKAQIDRALEYPEIYIMNFKDGSPYCKEKDPLYDPDAPDWSQYETPRHYYDEDEDNDILPDDWDKPQKNPLKEAARKGLAMGIGFGIVNNLFHGGSDGGSGSGS